MIFSFSLTLKLCSLPKPPIVLTKLLDLLYLKNRAKCPLKNNLISGVSFDEYSINAGSSIQKRHFEVVNLHQKNCLLVKERSTPYMDNGDAGEDSVTC